MQNYQSGSVLLLKLPFSDAVTFKFRPILLLFGFKVCIVKI
jgi:mRNA interferase MazF